MKTLKLILLSFFLFSIASLSAQEKQLPGMNDTVNYIEVLLKEAEGFNMITVSGSSCKMEGVEFSRRSYNLVKKCNTQEYETLSTNFMNADYSKVISVEDCDLSHNDNNLISNSPIQHLHIKFEKNICTYDSGFLIPGKRWEWEKENEATDFVYLNYKNTPGTRERLKKALEHLIMLSKKEKEEEKKNDPFAN